MTGLVLVRLGLRSLMLHKLRSGLSVLGVLVASKIGKPPQPRLGSGKPRPAEIPE